MSTKKKSAPAEGSVAVAEPAEPIVAKKTRRSEQEIFEATITKQLDRATKEHAAILDERDHCTARVTQIDLVLPTLVARIDALKKALGKE